MPKKTSQPSGSGSAEVDVFMAGLKHPLKPDIEAVRAILLGVDPAITEEVKWNSPGFRMTESFATVNLRSTDQVQLILHLGAKVRKDLPEMKIADPAGVMKWLGKDRALVTVGAGATLEKNRTALQRLVRAWIKFV